MNRRNAGIVRKAAIDFRTEIENVVTARAAKDGFDQNPFTDAGRIDIIADCDNPPASICTLNARKLKCGTGPAIVARAFKSFCSAHIRRLCD